MSTPRDAADALGGGSGWRWRLAGFDINVPVSALIGIAILAVLWYPAFAGAAGVRSGAAQWILAGIFGVLMMATVLVHELAHGLTARAFGYPVTGITLWAMGGFTVYKPSTKHGPGKEIAIALSGPVATLLIALVAYLAAQPVAPGFVRAILLALASANALVGFFNLLPGSPLDGGAVVTSLVWAVTGSQDKGRVASGWVGRALAVVIAVAPFVLAFQAGAQPSITFVLVALTLAFMLWQGASAQLRSVDATEQLQSITASSMAKPFITVRYDATVADVMPLEDSHQHVLVVDDEGRPVGAVTRAAAEAVPADARHRVSVMHVCARLTSLPVVPMGASAMDVLKACQDAGARFVFVADAEGRVVGAVDTDEEFTLEGP